MVANIERIYIYINFLYNLCNLSICPISKRRSSIGQILTKIKHKVKFVKWMVKVVKTWNLPSTTSSSHVASFLDMVFTFFVQVFWTNQNLTVLKKSPIFLYSILPQILKFIRPSLWLVILMKSVTSSYYKVSSREL